ncbi:adenosine kinase [Angomonas deanei]|nr:adenosine kinase [Angomonas deanei]|eukprot:EPY40868.1 adenosine kinase [Angomonas deanei]
MFMIMMIMDLGGQGGLLGEGAAVVLDDHTSSVVTHLAAAVDRLLEGVGGEETTDESIAGTVRVHNLIGGNGGDLDAAGLLAGRPHGGVAALREDDEALAGAVVGKVLGGLLGNVSDGRDVLPLEGLGEHAGLIVVGEEHIHVGEHLVEIFREELNNKRGREVHHEETTRLARRLRDLDHVVDIDGEGKAGEVEELAALQRLGHLRTVHVLLGEAVGGGEVGHQTALLAGDAHGTATSRGLGGVLQHHLHAILLGGVLEDLAVLVIGDTANVGNELLLGLGDPLGHTGGVEAGATRDVGHVRLLLELGVDASLLLGDEGGGGLGDLVLDKEGIVHGGRDIEQGVALDVGLGGSGH